MAEAAQARPEINEAAIRAAWEKFEAGLWAYPRAEMAQIVRLRVLPGLARSFAEFGRAGGKVEGERAAQMEAVAGAGVIEIVAADTGRAADDLQMELGKPKEVIHPAQGVLRQTLDQVLELREGIGNYVGVARRDDFERKTENVRKGLETRERSRGVMRRVEVTDQPDVSQIRGRRVGRVDVVRNNILTEDLRQAVDVLGKAFGSLGRPEWTPNDKGIEQIVSAVKVASARLLPEEYDRVVAGFGKKLFGELGAAFMALEEREETLTADERVKMRNYVKLFQKSFPMMRGVPAVKKFLLEIEGAL